MPQRRTARARDDDDRPAARRRRTDAPGLTVADAARSGLRSIAGLTGKRAEGVIAVEPAGDGWLVQAEVVEGSRVPSSTDLLAAYEAELGPDGSLVSCHRHEQYTRGYWR